MLSRLLALGRQLFSLSRDTERNSADIKALQTEIRDIREEMRDLTMAVKVLAVELHNLQQNEALARENLELRLRLAQSESTKALPPNE